MRTYTLLTLARAISVTRGQLLERAPIPGVVSFPFSQTPATSAQLQRRDGKVVDVSLGATYLNYVVNATVGTPPQPVTLTLDTGSSDIILLHQESAYCEALDGACPSVGYYNANKSSTYEYLTSNFTSNFGFADQGEGSGASGDVAKDTFTVAGTTVKDQQFAIAYGNFTLALSILGLSYASGENQVNTNPPQQPYDNFPLALAKQGATNLALFSLWKDTVTGYDGQILFGGIDTTKYTGALTTLETQKRDGFPDIIAFDVLLDSVALSGNSSFPKGSTGSVPVVLDCGTSGTILPDDWVKPIYDQFDITYFTANDTAYVDCDLQAAPYTVKYTFQSLNIEVPMTKLVSLRALNPKTCTFDIVPAGTRHALLGDNFLSSAYAVFDLTNNEISLAPREFSSTSDNVVAVPAGGVKAIGGSTTNPSSSGSPSASGTGTGTSETGAASSTTGTSSAASTTAAKKSAASIVSIPAYLIEMKADSLAADKLLLAQYKYIPLQELKSNINY
ncbi:hypothetical protein B7463_g6298, partial [Scytalidium lignicola]